jgi:hypothetical protein
MESAYAQQAKTVTMYSTYIRLDDNGRLASMTGSNITVSGGDQEIQQRLIAEDQNFTSTIGNFCNLVPSPINCSMNNLIGLFNDRIDNTTSTSFGPNQIQSAKVSHISNLLNNLDSINLEGQIYNIWVQTKDGFVNIHDCLVT